MVRQIVHSPATPDGNERGGAAAPPATPTRTPKDVRALFPAIANACYLNAGASSPLCVPVERALAAHLEETLQRGDAGFMRWLAKKEQVREQVASLIGVDAKDVAFTPSTSMGLWAAAEIMVRRGIKEVVTLESEFPSTTIPLLNAGITLRAVKARPDGSFHLDDLAGAVTRNTGGIALSQVQYASGFHLDVARVGDLARERNLFFVLNACQALGQVRVDAQTSGADIICGTSHKWLMGGFGGGIFYGKRELFAEEPAPWAGWLSTDVPWTMDPLAGATVTDEGNVKVAVGTKTRRSALALEAGSHSWTPILGLGASIEVLDSVGIAEVARHNAALQAQLRTTLWSRGFTPNAPDDQVAGICVIRVRGAPDDAAKALSKEGVLVSARGGGLRISTHVFNAPEDVARICDVIERLGIRPG